VQDVLNPDREITSATPAIPVIAVMPTKLTTGRREPAEQNGVFQYFGLHGGLHTATPASQAALLVEVGHMIGVTKDRVRTMQNKALLKLRGLFAESS
jgi:hypothetical protein